VTSSILEIHCEDGSALSGRPRENNSDVSCISAEARGKLRSATWLLVHVRESVEVIQADGGSADGQAEALFKHFERARQILRETGSELSDLPEAVTAGTAPMHLNGLALHARHLIQWIDTAVAGRNIEFAIR